ncbi:protein FAR1-related sequence 5, partial [Tanacetum coccineum]
VILKQIPAFNFFCASLESISAIDNTWEWVEELNALCTPESFVTHSNFDTPGGTVYYIPKVFVDVLLVKGNVYDSVDDCVVAYMKYAAEAGKFVLHVFDTIHNHELERAEYKNLSKTERQLNYMEQAFIVKAVSVNTGATRAHHLLTGIKGSYLLVHGTTVDFKNFFRSVNCYIGDSDAQMLIHKMENRKKHVSDFSFDYLVENVELTAIFWTDEVSKYIYREFGDVVSFDATFKTNKYKMICAKIYDETDFKEKLNKIVWNMYIGPKEFEYKWRKLTAEFKLENHKWLTKMFNIRSTWIPVYFIDSPLCGLMRTTSRSESENSFFSHFTNSGSTLMNFMNCFETVMEKQMHVQERMDHKTIDTVPKLKTLLKIEHHASNVYTRSLFELVQKEIFVGLFYCQIDSKCLVEGSEVCIIKESPYVYEMPNKKKKKPQSVDKGNDKAEENDKVDLFFKKDGLYKVLRNVGDGSVVCSCQLFVRVGILCKHIFCVFKNANVELIPQQYILRRWTKNLIPAALRNKRNRYGEKNVVVENYANEATSIVDHCVHLLSKDEPRLGAFVEKLKSLKKEVEADCPNPPSKNKTDNLEQLVGVPKPSVVDVNNPSVTPPKFGCSGMVTMGCYFIVHTHKSQKTTSKETF